MMAPNNSKNLYVKGLAEEVDINILKSKFLAFGDIIDITMPMDYSTQKHKGFAFVEYQWPEDAADAIDNMDNAEILGKTIRVNVAKPMIKNSSSKPIWADDEYLRKVEAGKEAAMGGDDDPKDEAQESDDEEA